MKLKACFQTYGFGIGHADFFRLAGRPAGISGIWISDFEFRDRPRHYEI
jgi:hypothetical protein